MPTVRLTDRSCAAAVAAPGQRTELQDLITPGLALRITPSGHKSWIVRYFSIAKGPVRYTLGTYPAISLSVARDLARETILAAQTGADPAEEKRRARLHAASEPIRTFDELTEAYFKACESGEWRPRRKQKRARTIADERAIIRRNVAPVLGRLRIKDITRKDIKALLRGMTGRGVTTQTNRTHAAIRQIFSFAIAEELVDFNPATGFSFLVEEKPRVRIWSDTELKKLWAALEDEQALRAMSVTRPVAIAIQLAAVTLQREGEIAGMRLDDINLEQAIWLIPGSQTKNGFPHLVPLSAAAIALIKKAIELAELRGGTSPFVFPSPRGLGKQAITGHSLGHAMVDIRRHIGVEGATVHDLRRTGSTALTSERIGVLPFIRSKVLNHRSDSGGGASVSAMVYDANEYVSEKRKALSAWSSLLLQIVDAESASKSATPRVRKRVSTSRAAATATSDAVHV